MSEVRVRERLAAPVVPRQFAMIGRGAFSDTSTRPDRMAGRFALVTGLHLACDCRPKGGFDYRQAYKVAKLDTDAHKETARRLVTAGLLDTLHFSRIEDPTYMAGDRHTEVSCWGVMTKEGLESCLLEMMVVRKGVGDLSLAHHRKRNAVGQRPGFVQSLAVQSQP